MSIFDKFDKEVNLEELKEQVATANENSGNYEEVPSGIYVAKIEKMELKTTKDGRPMFFAQFRIVEGEFKKHCLFMNRVMFGTKNDANMISSVVGWLNKIGFEEPVVFEGYAKFADLVLDLAEECENLEFEIEYDPTEFNAINISEVYDA